MPIKSYLVHPQEGKKMELAVGLSKMEHCEVVPAQNENILVLVTETETKQEEAILKEKLEELTSIKLMAMVSGFDTPKNKEHV